MTMNNRGNYLINCINEYEDGCCRKHEKYKKQRRTDSTSRVEVNPEDTHRSSTKQRRPDSASRVVNLEDSLLGLQQLQWSIWL